MKCRNIQLLLPDYGQGQSTGEEALMVKDHLAHCSSCAGELRAMIEALENLKSLSFPEPPAGYWESIVPNVHERRARKSTASVLSVVSRWTFRYLAPSAALVLTVVVVGSQLFNGKGNDSDVATVVERLSGDELVQVADQATLNTEVTNSVAEPSLGSSEDADLLRELLTSDDRSAVYASLDVDDATSSLTEQEEAQLVASLQQQPDSH